MKFLFNTSICLLLSLLLFSCSKEDKKQDNFLMRWAETNCGASVTGDYYYSSANPCPEGYHIPLQEDFRTLLSYPRRYAEATENTPGNVHGVWVGLTTNNVNKATASDTHGCLFFPKTGYQFEDRKANNTIINPEYGYYWTSSIATNARVWRLTLLLSDVFTLKDDITEDINGYYKFLVRCIKDEKK